MSYHVSIPSVILNLQVFLCMYTCMSQIAYIYVCAVVIVYMYVPQFSPLAIWVWGQNSVSFGWRQVSLPTEPYHWPQISFPVWGK